MALYFPPFILAILCSVLIQVMVSSDVVNDSLVSISHVLIYPVILLGHMIFILVLTAYFSAKFNRVNRVMGWSYSVGLLYLLIPLIFVLAYQSPVFPETLFDVLSPLSLIASIPKSSIWGDWNWIKLALEHLGLYLMASMLFYYLTYRILKHER